MGGGNWTSIILLFVVFVSTIVLCMYNLFSSKTYLFFKFISLLLIFMIAYLFTRKELFLPFLATAAYPPSLIPGAMHPPNTNFSIELDLNYPDGTKVIYWASDNKATGSNEIYNNPQDAYGSYKNSGVAVINNNKTIIHLNCPDRYKIPTGTTLKKHVHYRLAFPNNPILSSVQTIYINC